MEAPAQERYIFGTGIFSQEFHRIIPFSAFVEMKPALSELMGCPVIGLDDVPVGSVIVNGACLWPFKANSLLLERGFQSPHVLYAAKEILGKLLYFPEFRNQIKGEREILLELRKRLSDDKSISLLESVINFRITGNINYLYKKCSEQLQYFEDVIDITSIRTFFDIGAFDGENTHQFMNRNRDFQKIHMFDPNPQNRKSLLEISSKDKRVFFSEIALSDSKGLERFDSKLGSSSRFSKEGDVQIRVDVLDSFIREYPDYLKFDIEGGELSALRGGHRLFKELKPKLAVSVYHRSSDLIEIFQELVGIYSNAKFYLRQYTEGTDEIIMYVIP
jgi:FkbM family methyltransferase